MLPPLPLNKTLKFKFCICIILSYGFSLCALKCTNLTSKSIQPKPKPLKDQKTQPPVNDLLINLLFFLQFCTSTNQSINEAPCWGRLNFHTHHMTK